MAEKFTGATLTAESARAAGLMEGYKCGFCLNTFENMREPKVLPCSHVFCLGCLQADYHFKGRTECPVCRAADVDNLESLREATIQEDEDAIVAGDVPTCNAPYCNLNAVSYCVFDGYKFCKKHDESHEELFKSDEKHMRMTIREYLAAPGPFTEVFCPTHKNYPLSLVCDPCQKTLCTLCLHECSSTKQKYTFIDMREKLKEEYDELQNKLAAKHREICRLEKMVWRRLDDITSRSREMKKEVDRKTDEQMQAIRKKAEELKKEIDDYMQKHTEESEKFTTKLTEDQKYIENIQHEIKRVMRMAPTAQLVDENKERLERITEGISIKLEKCVLEECTLTSKDPCRDIEYRTRSTVPFQLVYQASYTVSYGTPDSATIINDDTVVLKAGTVVWKLTLSSYAQTEKADHPELRGIIDMTNSKEANTNIKVYFLNLPAAIESISSSATAGQENSETAQGAVQSVDTEACKPLLPREWVEKESILLAHDDEKGLKIYMMKGNILFTITTGSSTVRTSCALDDDCILVSFGTTIAKYARGASKVPMWTCDGLMNIDCMAEDVKTGLIYASAINQRQLQVISPEGKFIKELTLPNYYPQNLGAMATRDDKIMLFGYMNSGYHWMSLATEYESN